MFTEPAKLKSISILIQSSANRPIYADKAMIDTILRNLISNAIKFTCFEGTITISLIENQDEVIISIADTGVGISKDRICKIFSLDECYSTPRTNKEQGTGLGLILCKEFVEKHSGRIWAKSEEEQGSEFRFTIPIREPLN